MRVVKAAERRKLYKNLSLRRRATDKTAYFCNHIFIIKH